VTYALPCWKPLEEERAGDSYGSWDGPRARRLRAEGRTTREQFLATDAGASSWGARAPGFVSHELSYAAETDRWIELARWETLEHAKAAAEAAMSSKSCAPMFALIDMESVLMLHGEPATAPLIAEHRRVEA